MVYEVVITPDAQKDWDNALSYISLIKKNPQAVINLNNDFEDAVCALETAAGSLKLDDDSDIAAIGYHRIHLDKHNYFILLGSGEKGHSELGKKGHLLVG